jgi:hypothetical protein
VRRRSLLAASATGALVAAWLLLPHLGIAHVTTTNTVVFEREIVRILEARCVACHSGSGAAPRLVTYEDVWLERDRVLASVLEGRMPPWAPVRGYGDFANDNGVTPREKQFLVSWVEGLGPRNAGELFLNVGGAAGEAGDPVQVRLDPRAWELGEPDALHVLPPPVVGPGAEARVERVTVDLGLRAERWVTGLELEPGEPGVVRAASFFVEESGQWLGSWTPWHSVSELPETVAYRLTPGTRLVVEVHRGHGTTSERAAAAGRLGLFFAPDDATDLVVPSEIVLEARGEGTGPGSRLRLYAEAPIRQETRVFSLLPQLDGAARSIEVSVRRPDGGTEILLFARDVPEDWPTPYMMREPVVVPPGSVLRATAYLETPSDGRRAVGFRVRVSRF